MIRVKPPPQAVAKEQVDAGTESTAAIELFEDKPENASAKFKFKAYKLPVVSTTLNPLFGWKCAYCESYFGATQPVAIEHFRPKGQVLVEGKRRRPGYYWLAGTWSNLLPSCTDCNSERTQRLSDGTVEVVGKQNQFPIVSEKKRAKKRGQETAERRLLLHPYYDDPPKHLAYDAEGVVGWTPLGGKPSRKGKESIRVYALNRDGLVRARQRLLADLNTEMETVRNLRNLHEADPGNAAIEAEFDRHLTLLESYTVPERPYSEMARQLVEAFLRDLRDG